MKESLVKLLVVLIALASVFVGGAFVLIPSWVADYTGTSAEPGWLRSIGAATVGIQGFGLLITAFRRRDTNPLLGIVSLVTTLEMGVMWYSVFSGGYGETNRLALVAVAILATVAAGVLWLSWSSRRKSLSGGAPSKVTADAGQPDEPQADLVEEIDSQSPRFKE